MEETKGSRGNTFDKGEVVGNANNLVKGEKEISQLDDDSESVDVMDHALLKLESKKTPNEHESASYDPESFT